MKSFVMCWRLEVPKPGSGALRFVEECAEADREQPSRGVVACEEQIDRHGRALVRRETISRLSRGDERAQEVFSRRAPSRVEEFLQEVGEILDGRLTAMALVL